MDKLSHWSQPAHIWIAIALVLIAAFFRLHHLDQLPPGLYHDEAYYGLDAQRLLRTGHLAIFFPGNNGREPLHIYLLAGALFLLGNHAWTLRLVSAFSGILAIPLIYRFGRELLRDEGPRAEWAGLAAAAVLGVSYWHLNFSRVAFRAIHLVPCSLLAVWLFWRGWQKKSYHLFAWSGLWLGISLYTYLAARLLPLVITGFVLIQALRMWGPGRLPMRSVLRRPEVLGSMVTLLVAVLVFAPLGTYFLFHPESFVQRSQGLSIFSPGAAANDMPLPTLGSNLLAVARMFVDRGDILPRHNLPGRPALDPPGQVGFLIAIALSLAQRGRPRYVLLWIWLLSMLLPTALSIEAPHFLRAIGALPPLCLLVGDGLTWVWDALTRRWPSHWPVAWPALIVSVVILSGGLTYRDYFFRWAQVPEMPDNFDLPEYTIAQRALALSESYDVALPLEIYSQPTALFVLEPVFSGLVPILARPQPRPTLLLDPAGIPLHSLVVLHRAPDQAASAFVTRPLEPQAALKLRQLPGGPSLTDSFGRAAAREVYGIDRWIPGTPSPGQSTGDTFANLIALTGYDLGPSVVSPGEIVHLVLYWKSLNWPVEDYQVFVHLVAATGVRLDQRDTPPLDGAYPTSLWHPGDIIPDSYTFTMTSDILPGKYRFEIGLYPQGAGQRLSVTGPTGPAGDFVPVGIITVPDPALDQQARASRVDVAVGDPPTMKLVSYDLPSETVAPGGMLNLVLYWQALRAMDRDYTIFVHLLDGAGQIRAQQDMQPVADRAPTSWWVPGEVLRDEHPIRLDPDVAPGTYTLSVGVYYWATGERLPLFDTTGRPLADDRVVLSTPITVRRNAP